ncbi:MAG TPA: bifunctional YncE family protein/alkaline phosphatase family protein [Myxococcales bacterium]
MDAGEAFDACVLDPPPEALVPAGLLADRRILPGGRALTPAGTSVVLGGFPVEVRLHPTLPVAYVSNTGFEKRALQVVDLRTGTILQDLPRSDGFRGLAVAPDGSWVLSSGGYSATVDVHAVDAAGKLTSILQIPVSGYPAGIAASRDGRRAWVGLFQANGIVELDTTTWSVTRVLPCLFGVYSVLEVPSRNELYAAGFATDRVAVIDLAAGTLVATPTAGQGPADLAASTDGTRVLVAVSNEDQVRALDISTHEVAGGWLVGAPELTAADGTPLPGRSPSSIAVDPATGRVFVARAADNAIEVLDGTTFATLGAIPTDWYPTSVALGEGGRTLVVANGKGIGAGPVLSYTFPSNEGTAAMKGTLQIVDLTEFDLTAGARKVGENLARPSQVFPQQQCGEGPSPIPAAPGEPTPLKHVVLIVRENKTYDSLMSDLPGNGDPSLLLYGEKITPNLHALARRFTHHDNFYDDAEISIQGHLWLTSSFVNDFIERTWFELLRGRPGFEQDSVLPQGRPSFLSFFAHLVRHGISLRIYGEIVGALDEVDGTTMTANVDLGYPGAFFNLGVKDEAKAAHVVSTLLSLPTLPDFVFIALPNDHTVGLAAGAPTPESMINDNDYATGLIVDGLSHSKYWSSTAIFIVEDDSQNGADHVDYHRSIAVVASPWAKRGHVS